MEHARPAWLHLQKKAQRAAEQDRPDVAAARQAWCAAQPGLNPAKLVFIDESGFATDMARRYGRSRRGRRLPGAVPHGHWKTSTLIAGLRHDGIVAPLVIDHPMNGVTFRAYVEQLLAPTLTPGDVVIADNLSCHRNAHARAAVEAMGATFVRLPAYSPDLNPIEQVFSKLKALIRTAMPRTVEALSSAIGDALGRVTKAECANYLANSGYPQLM